MSENKVVALGELLIDFTENGISEQGNPLLEANPAASIITTRKGALCVMPNKKDKHMAELKITRENFENEVMKSDIPVLIDFWAPWCGPCRMMGQIIEQLADEYEGKAKVGKVNVDEEPELSQEFGIMSIPTIVLMKEGKVVKQVVGARPKAELEAML